MAALQHEVLDVLLDTLMNRGLINRDVYDKAKNIVNSTPDFEEFFWHPVYCQEEGESHGCTENQE